MEVGEEMLTELDFPWKIEGEVEMRMLRPRLDASPSRGPIGKCNLHIYKVALLRFHGVLSLQVALAFAVVLNSPIIFFLMRRLQLSV
jgi:hypothetical protein